MSAKAKSGKSVKAAPPSIKLGPGFIQELKLELRRVDWPTRSKVVKASLAVLTVVIVSVIFISLVDLLLSRVFQALNVV